MSRPPKHWWPALLALVLMAVALPLGYLPDAVVRFAAPLLYFGLLLGFPFILYWGHRHRRRLLIADLGLELGGAVSRRQGRLFALMMSSALVVGLLLDRLGVPAEAIAAVFSGVSLAFVPVYLHRRRSLGAVLFEPPWSESDTRALVGNGVLVVAALISTANEGRIRILGLALFGVGMVSLIFGLHRFQIRDGGIVASGRVLEWRALSSLQWRGDDERPVLVFETSGLLGAWGPEYWIVPSGHKLAVNEILMSLSAVRSVLSQGRPPNTGLDLTG